MPAAPGSGDVEVDASGRVTSLVAPTAPANDAGFDEDDQLTRVDGKSIGRGVTLATIVGAHKPGERITVEYRHPDGTPGTGVVTLAEDPEMEAVPIESAGGHPDRRRRRRSAVPGSARSGADYMPLMPFIIRVIVMSIIRPIGAGGRRRKKTWNDTGRLPYSGFRIAGKA